jgi:TATA-box binding protein (TBP) (component of TFIID and TFIIIB)
MTESYTKSSLRISTMVITAHWGTKINLDTLFEQLKSIIIPIWYPEEGILKFEHKGMVLGMGHKDIFTNRKITSKSFFNQSTIVVRRKVNTNNKQSFKEVNVKLFANGGIQMTGVVSEDFAREVAEWLLETINGIPVKIFNEPAKIEKFSVKLINTDYELNKFINQDALHKILINEYNLFSMLEKTIYQGVNTKFFYNTTNNSGICNCDTEKICKGQGTGEGKGECKRITMSIFRTGRIIITGARTIEQINAAYKFLNGVFDKHHAEVLYQPNTV